jgi:predicted transposase/invertase (TIGR01784 family)
MQVVKEKAFVKRAQYYAARVYGSQLVINSKYYALKEVIFLAITDFVMFPNKKEYKSDHIILDKMTYEHDLKDFSFTFLELPKIKKTLKESVDKIDKWAYFFKHAKEASEEEVAYFLSKENVLYRAYQELDHFSWTRNDLLAYDAARKDDMDHEAIMDQRFDDGEAKGLDKGIKIGKEEGIKIGEKTGKEEGIKIGEKIGKEEGIKIGEKKAKIKMAQDLLKAGVSIDIVISTSQLSREEIESLKS